MSLLMDCAKEAEILGEELINELARPIRGKTTCFVVKVPETVCMRW